MPSFTPNYNLERPTVGSDLDVWGGKLNTNFTKIDTALKGLSDSGGTISSDLATFKTQVMKLDGTQSMTAPLTLVTGNPTTDNHAARKKYVDDGLSVKAPLASPALTGTPTAPTAAVDTNTTQLATTAYVVGQGYLKATTATATYAAKASPALTGTPTAPTPAVNTNTTQIATTAYVVSEILNRIPVRPTYNRVTSDQSIVNSIAYTANPTLQFALTAGKTYTFEAFLIVSCSATTGIRVGILATQTPQAGAVIIHNTTTTTQTNLTSITTTAQNLYTGTAALSYALIKVSGHIVANATTGGSLQISIGQSAVNAANPAIIRAGSVLSYIQIT